MECLRHPAGGVLSLPEQAFTAGPPASAEAIRRAPGSQAEDRQGVSNTGLRFSGEQDDSPGAGAHSGVLCFMRLTL